MRAGRSGPDALKGLLAADKNRVVRQVAIIDAQGKVATHRGSKCIPMAGHHVGEEYSVQANLILDEKVWAVISRAFEATKSDLTGRMLAAHEAAQAAGRHLGQAVGGVGRGIGEASRQALAGRGARPPG